MVFVDPTGMNYLVYFGFEAIAMAIHILPVVFDPKKQPHSCADAEAFKR